MGGLDSLKTSLWLATGSGVAFFAGSSLLKWKWPNNSFTNHWAVASILGASGVTAAAVSKNLLDKPRN